MKSFYYLNAAKKNSLSRSVFTVALILQTEPDENYLNYILYIP